LKEEIDTVLKRYVEPSYDPTKNYMNLRSLQSHRSSDPEKNISAR